jgi:hypothetical protein
VHQAATLTLLRRGHVRRRQLPEHGELGQLQRVVLVRLALDARPAPRLVRGVGHEHRDPQRDGEVVDPAGDVAGLDHQQRRGGVLRRVRRQQVVDLLRRGLHADDEAVVVRERVVGAQHAGELAEVQREDAGDVGRMRKPMHGGCSFRAANGV